MKTIKNPCHGGGYNSPSIEVISAETSSVLCASGLWVSGEQPGETDDLN